MQGQLLIINLQLLTRQCEQSCAVWACISTAASKITVLEKYIEAMENLERKRESLETTRQQWKEVCSMLLESNGRDEKGEFVMCVD